MALKISFINTMCQHILYYFKNFLKSIFKSFVNMLPGSSIFGVNLLTLFCKLDRFIDAFIIFLSCGKMKLSKRVSKFTPK